MNSSKIHKLGIWVAASTLFIGALVLIDYFIEPDTEKGMAIYLFNVFAGIINIAVLLVILIRIFFSEGSKVKLLITSAMLLMVYSLLFIISYFFVFSR